MLGLVGFDVSMGGCTRARHAILTLDRFSTEMTANDELWSFIRRPTYVLSKILLPRIENSLLSPQEAAKELPRGRRSKTTVNLRDDEPTGESAYLVTR